MYKMSFSLSSMICKPLPNPQSATASKLPLPMIGTRSQSKAFVSKCELKEQSSKLSIGSPVVITEAPELIKTAASVPCLRVNSGLVNPGDVGRIVSRKPMYVWAVRLSIGTYLIDRKYFKLLEVDE